VIHLGVICEVEPFRFDKQTTRSVTAGIVQREFPRAPPFEKNHGEMSGQALFWIPVIGPDFGRIDITGSLESIPADRFAQDDIGASLIGHPALAGGAPTQVAIGIVKSFLVFFFVFVQGRPGCGIPLPPEALNK